MVRALPIGLLIVACLVSALPPQSSAQENVALCDRTSERTIEATDINEGLLYCFDGVDLHLRNETKVVLHVDSPAHATRIRSGGNFAAHEIARLNGAPEVLPPGFSLRIRVDESKLEINIRGDLDRTNEYLRTELKVKAYGFVPGAGDALQAMNAFSAWLAEMELITIKRDDCLERSNGFGDIVCGTQFGWNINFANSRAIIEGIPIINDVGRLKDIADLLGAALDGAELVRTVSDLAAFARPGTISVGESTAPAASTSSQVETAIGQDEDNDPAIEYGTQDFRRPDPAAMVAGGSSGASPLGRAVPLGDVPALNCRLSDLFNFCIQRSVPELLTSVVAIASDKSDSRGTLFYSQTREDRSDGTEVFLELRSLMATAAQADPLGLCRSLVTGRTQPIATAAKVRGKDGVVCNHWDHGLVSAPISSVIWYEAGALHRVSVTRGSPMALTGELDNLSALKFRPSELLAWVNAWASGPPVKKSDACGAYWTAIRGTEVVGTEAPDFLDGMRIEYSLDALTVAGRGPRGEYQVIGDSLDYIPEGVVELLGTRFEVPALLLWDRDIPGIMCTLGEAPTDRSDVSAKECSDSDQTLQPCTREEVLERVVQSMGGRNDQVLGGITSASAYSFLATEPSRFWDPGRCGVFDGEHYCVLVDSDGEPLVLILDIAERDGGLYVSDASVTSTH